MKLLLSGAPEGVEFDDLQDFMEDVALDPDSAVELEPGRWLVTLVDPTQLKEALARDGDVLATGTVTVTRAPDSEEKAEDKEAATPVPLHAAESEGGEVKCAEEVSKEGDAAEEMKEAREGNEAREDEEEPPSAPLVAGDEEPDDPPCAPAGSDAGEPMDDGPPPEALPEDDSSADDTLLQKAKKRKHKKEKKEKKDKKERKEKKERHRERKKNRTEEPNSSNGEEDNMEEGGEAPPTSPVREVDEPSLLEGVQTPAGRPAKERPTKYSSDYPSGPLMKDLPRTPAPPPPSSPSAAPARQPINLEELAEVKSQLLAATSEERWEDAKLVLKSLLLWEPKLEDLQVTRLGMVMAELKKQPALEVFADIVLRMWKSLAAKHGVRPKAPTPARSPVTSPLTSPVVRPAPVSPITSPPAPPAPPSPAPTPLSLEEPTAEPSAAADPQKEVPDTSNDPSEQEAWAFYEDSSFSEHTSQPRNVMTKRLYHALLTRDEENQAEYLKAGSRNPRVVAKEIEEAIFVQYGSTSERLRHKFGQIFTNMANRANNTLRGNVLNGEISPTALVQMRVEDMGHDDMRMRRQQTKDYARDAARRDWGEKRVTDTFKCSKCHQRKTTYFQMQTRSADEPMTTFVTCANCGHAWKF